MPTYQYECTACGNEFEELQGMLDPKLTTCSKCNKKTLIRLIGAGSGFSFSSGYTDASGEKIHFPKEGYYDVAMRRHFNSAKEKFEFMKANNIVSTGDTDAKVEKERKEHREEKLDTCKKEKK
jgi:putative FmdB family regulatory protein